VSRFIDANSFYELVNEHRVKERGAYTKGYNAALKAVKSDLHNVDATPTVEVVPVVHGRWVEKDGWTRCSKCDRSSRAYMPPYCSHCGAKMDEEEA
jgi:hypothetical protein